VNAPARRTHRFDMALTRGFTLIEMLVVLLVMGLLAGLVTATATPDDRARLNVEAERLAQLIHLAATESRLTGKAVAWTANGPGYRFWRFSEASGWSQISDDVLRARTLPQGMTISRLQVDNLRPAEHMRLQFNPHGAAPSFSVEMSLGEARGTVEGSPVGEVRVVPQGGNGNDSFARR
jgi:general secretion pathway protein H